MVRFGRRHDYEARAREDSLIRNMMVLRVARVKCMLSGERMNGEDAIECAWLHSFIQLGCIISLERTQLSCLKFRSISACFIYLVIFDKFL
jgi:hypothetical protein